MISLNQISTKVKTGTAVSAAVTLLIFTIEQLNLTGVNGVVGTIAVGVSTLLSMYMVNENNPSPSAIEAVERWQTNQASPGGRR